MGRLGALLLGCALAVMMVFMPVSPAMAQSVIAWDELQAPSTHVRHPHERLNTEQIHRLSDLHQLKEWVQENQPLPNSLEAQAIQRLEKVFADEGLEPTGLLTDADEARAD